MKIKNIVLPYISQIERLYIAIVEENITLKNNNEWYYSFLYDPIDFLLLTNQIEMIYLVTRKKRPKSSRDSGVELN